VPTNYVALNANGITVTSPVKVTINAPTTDINANVNIVGNTVFTGTVIANDHVIDERHTHTGVTAGPTITGQVSI
jgi:phage baseplate assembly protein gpV